MKRCKLVPRRFLDPRAADEARAKPILDAVNIPLAELPQRMHELPPRDERVLVVGTAEQVRLTTDWLRAHGRQAGVATGFCYADGPVAGEIGRLWRPTPWLAEILPQLVPGRALELACGTGRDAIYMAAEGWQVTAIDVLPDALERGRDLEARCAGAPSPINWRLLDLEVSPPDSDAEFELIVGLRYLHRPLLADLARWLAPGGSVIWETFTTVHRERHNKPAGDDDVLRAGELPTLLPEFTVRAYAEEWRGDRHTARIWATRAS